MIRTSILAASALSICASAAFAETKTYDVPSFTGMDVSAGLDVKFETGTAQSVTVENTKGDFSEIDISVKRGTLIIKRPRSASGWNMGWSKKERYAVIVTVPELNALEVSSGADVDGSGMSGDLVRIDVSSGADANISDIKANRVRLESSSGSDLTASGQCTEVRAESSSGSDIVAADLICEDGEGEASSGSDIVMHASNNFSGDVSSGADIVVLGRPDQTTVDESSGGSVKFR